MGENGGGAFVLVYLVCVVIVGAPVFLAELTIGRHTHRNPVGAMQKLRPGRFWPAVGGMGVLAGFLILSYYSVIAGWTLGYTIEGIVAGAASPESPAASQAYFAAFTSSSVRVVGYHALFMIATIMIVARGVRSGIEWASKIMMPAFLTLLMVLIVRGLLLPGSGAGVAFILRPDWSRLTPEVIFNAMGQAFFTLSLGMGAMITYGSYMASRDNLVRSSAEVAGMDTLVAVVAGFAIFPALFALGMEPEQGAGLIFATLPAVFAEIPGGAIFAFMFFFLMLLAALTSSISLLEVCSCYFIDQWNWSRTRAAWVLGGIILLLGVPAALGTSVWQNWSIATTLGAMPGEGFLGNIGILQQNWFGLMESITANYMLPGGGLLIAVFVGYVWTRADSVAELKSGYPSFRGAPLWLNLLRYVCPLVVAQILFVGVLGEFQPGYFPTAQALIDRLVPWFAWIDIIVAAVVVGFGIIQMFQSREQPAS
jgi:NSS family neurotransmitter:Na+ symporter